MLAYYFQIMNYKYRLLVRHAMYQCFIEDCIIYRQLLRYLHDTRP